MLLSGLDWIVVTAYGTLALAAGLYFARRAGTGRGEYFLGGRSMPWWLLGTSMVATTFSTDTPNFVTGLVRSGGVSGNWVWWAFLLTGMCTVFFYARLWRRSKVLTDLGFYELRYSGPPATFLRGFRAVYLGLFFNVMVMATVTLAAIKIGGVLLGASKLEVVLIAGAVTAAYAAVSGLWGVVVTDLLLFVVAMAGSLAAAWFALDAAHLTLGRPEEGALTSLLAAPELAGKLSLLPDFSDLGTATAIFIIPIAVQWWSTWYPGAEPGGGGYVAQRMLAARDEGHALKATLWFNIANYALRPWPWILVALASLVVYPNLESIQAAFPGVDPSIVRNDLAYPAMLVFLPAGLLGLVVASLAAAYMSTISTHLNWGASYLVDDVYRRFIAKDLSERSYVLAARLATVLLIVLAGVIALWFESASQSFSILLQIGAGSGLVFLLRWFWWRINAWSEIAAMVSSFLVALYFHVVQPMHDLPPEHWLQADHWQLVVGVLVTSLCWVTVTFLTRPADRETLRNFYRLIRPMGPGWRGSGATEGLGTAPRGGPARALLSWFVACVVVYAALFGTGNLLYGETLAATACFGVGAPAAFLLFRTMRKGDLV